MSPPAEDLNRFLQAQNAGDPSAYSRAIAELRAGRKRSHWILLVLPQLQGLGRSAISQRFGIRGLAEARAYLAHPVLGARWSDTLRVLAEQLSQPGPSLEQLMGGELDALKTMSFLTVMAQAGCPQAGALLAQLEGEGWKPCAFTLRRMKTNFAQQSKSTTTNQLISRPFEQAQSPDTEQDSRSSH